MRDPKPRSLPGNTGIEIVRKPYTVFPRPGNCFHLNPSPGCSTRGTGKPKCKQMRLKKTRGHPIGGIIPMLTSIHSSEKLCSFTFLSIKLLVSFRGFPMPSSKLFQELGLDPSVLTSPRVTNCAHSWFLSWPAAPRPSSPWLFDGFCQQPAHQPAHPL